MGIFHMEDQCILQTGPTEITLPEFQYQKTEPVEKGIWCIGFVEVKQMDFYLNIS